MGRGSAAARAAASPNEMATRPSFRPRPIDSSRPLPILRTSKDLRHADDVVVSRALPQVGTGVEAAELEERHLQQALLASVYGENAKNSKSFDIPIPVFENVATPACPIKAAFVRPPNAYIMFDKSDEDLESSFVDYDGDHIDESFVAKYNIAHKKQPIPLDMDGLETAMDALEKLQGRTLAEEEDTMEAEVVGKSDPKKGASAAATAAAAVAAAAAAKKKETRETLLQFSQMRSELVATLPTCTDIGRRELHAHWVDRRLAHGSPFHRLYIKAPATNDPNPGVAFRPRGREDGGGGRRMNTYENFKRARLLRDEFEVLRGVMESVLSRERLKAEQLALSALQTRVHCVASGGARLASISRNIVAFEREGFSIGDGDAKIAVSCRGLGADLPLNVESELNRMPFGPEKAKTKKTKRKSVGGGANRADGKVGVPSATIGDAGSALGDAGQHGATDGKGLRPQAALLSQANHVDSYGFDDHGNRFLKHMRYFAGGFMNYGVCPYDHRVFAAASERNTVKDHPREPKPFSFPASNMKFGRRGQAIGGKLRPRQSVKQTTAPSQQPWSSPFSGSSDVCHDAHVVGRKRLLGSDFGSNVSKRIRRPIKVRGRVGRGGRVFMDRVAFEPERGVKAASYPASVEMGGVFTAGLPLEVADRVAAEEVGYGTLGYIDDLVGSAEDRALIGPLQPMVKLARGHRGADGHIVYWPSRKAACVEEASQSEIEAGYNASSAREHTDSRSQHASNAEDLRKMPTYASRALPLVEILDSE